MVINSYVLYAYKKEPLKKAHNKFNFNDRD
jgi:hypothetical protein